MSPTKRTTSLLPTPGARQRVKRSLPIAEKLYVVVCGTPPATIERVHIGTGFHSAFGTLTIWHYKQMVVQYAPGTWTCIEQRHSDITHEENPHAQTPQDPDPPADF